MKILKWMAILCLAFLTPAWLIGLWAAGTHVSPYVVAAWAAMPLVILGAAYLVGLGAVLATVCHMEDGVSWGALIVAIFVSPLAWVAIALVAGGWPFIAGVALEEKWFPKKEKRELPPDHWSNKIAFRCRRH